MLEITRQQVVDCLRSLGICSGDGLLIHSALQFFGRPVGGVGMYLEAILEVIGPDGTIAVPTFNFSFARGEPYDPSETPSQGMGAFSEYVRKYPGARRTSHPMQSLAILGRYAEELAGRDTLSAFDPHSAFEGMLELDFKLLLLGSDASAISMFHYCEQRAQVPYRYWKDFHGRVRTPQGWQERTYRMYVRDLELNPQLTPEPFQKLLEERGQWLTAKLNYGTVATCRLADFVAACDQLLAEDPWQFVKNVGREKRP